MKNNVNNTGSRSMTVEQLRDEIKSALYGIAHEPTYIDFTRDNYNTLFPRNRIATPIENVKLGGHQFEKLEAKERQKILSMVYETLTTPDIVINEKRKSVFGDDENSHIYARSYMFDKKARSVQSVVVSISDENVSISTHERKMSNLVNKIKMPDQLLYASRNIGQVIEQHTRNSVQSVVNQTGTFNSEPPNKDYHHSSVLSIKELVASGRLKADMLELDSTGVGREANPSFAKNDGESRSNSATTILSQQEKKSRGNVPARRKSSNGWDR